MSITSFLFYSFAALVSLSALALVMVRQVFHGALWVIVGLLSLAGMYVFAMAEFVAVAQIMVYAGGILVVIIFGIMLTGRMSGKSLQVKHTHLSSGVLAGVALFGLLLYLLRSATFITPQETLLNTSSVQGLGTAMMTDYLLPFEISGIVLLVALIGAAVVASTRKPAR